MALADYFRGANHLHHFRHMLLFHLSNHCRCTVFESLRDVRQLTLNHARCTQKRVILQELIVAMQQRILQV